MWDSVATFMAAFFYQQERKLSSEECQGAPTSRWDKCREKEGRGAEGRMGGGDAERQRKMGATVVVKHVSTRLWE